VSIAAFGESVVAGLFSPLLHATKPAIANNANTFFIVLVFGLFYNRRKDNGIIELSKY
jgi:hypothetical protein